MTKNTKSIRMIVIDDKAFTIPKYVNRVANGWQFRIRGVYSVYFGDNTYGGVEESLKEAVKESVNFNLKGRYNEN